MPEANPLALEHSESGSVQILPRPPLLTSHKLGWNGIHVEHHQQPAWETIEHSLTHHTIVIHHFEHPIGLEQMVEGRSHSQQIVNGHITIIPANVQQKISWERECDFTLLFIEPAHIAQIAHESVDGDRPDLIPHFAKPDPLIYQIGLAFKAELEVGVGSRLYAQSAATMLSAHLLRHYSAEKYNLQEYKHKSSLSKYKLRQVIDYINDNLDEDLSLVQLASVVQISPYYFARLFKQSIGVAPHQYLLQCRIEKAKRLLAREDLSIAQISQQVGFNDQSCFTTKFRTFVGVTPKKYRSQL